MARARSIHFTENSGLLLWDKCGMSRHEKGLRERSKKSQSCGTNSGLMCASWAATKIFNQSLERAAAVADFLEFAELMCMDALERDESSGAHFREEHQTPDGEALRDDEKHAAVFAWEFRSRWATAKLYSRAAAFRDGSLTQRSYK